MPEESGATGPGKSEWRQNDNLENIKMLRMRENSRDLHDMLSNPKTSDEDLKWAATQCFINSSKLKGWLERIDQYKLRKIPISGHPGEFYRRIRDDTEVYQDFENTALLEWNQKCKSLDSTSQVASIDFLVEGKRFPYGRIDKTFFLSWAGKGRLLVLNGEKDSGKSDWACQLAKIAIDNKLFKIFSNIELAAPYVNKEDPRYEYVYCKMFSTMVKLICKAKLEGIPTIIIVDEAGIEFASYEQQTTRAKEFDKFGKLTRKFGTNVIFISQYWDQVPYIFKENCSAWMEKGKRRTLLRYAIYAGDEAGFDDSISNIPKTELPFDTDHISGMTMNLRFRDIFDFLDSLPPLVNQFERLAKWVEQQELKPDQKEFTAKQKKFMTQKLLAQKVGGVGLSTDALAKMMDVRPSTIRAWARGQASGYADDESDEDVYENGTEPPKKEANDEKPS